jgi:hypothetical protein
MLARRVWCRPCSPGAAQENVHDNRVMAAELGAQLPDMQSDTAWRYVLRSHLAHVLEEPW